MWCLLEELENHPVIFILGILFVASLVGGLIDEGYIRSPCEIWNDFWDDRREKWIDTIEPEMKMVEKEIDTIRSKVKEYVYKAKYGSKQDWQRFTLEGKKEEARKRLVVLCQYIEDWKCGLYFIKSKVYGLNRRLLKKKRWISHVLFWEEKRKRISQLLSELTPKTLSLIEWMADEKGEMKEVEIFFSSLVEEIRSIDKWEKMNLKGEN